MSTHHKAEYWSAIEQDHVMNFDRTRLTASDFTGDKHALTEWRQLAESQIALSQAIDRRLQADLETDAMIGAKAVIGRVHDYADAFGVEEDDGQTRAQIALSLDYWMRRDINPFGDVSAEVLVPPAILFEYTQADNPGDDLIPTDEDIALVMEGYQGLTDAYLGHKDDSLLGYNDASEVSHSEAEAIEVTFGAHFDAAEALPDTPRRTLRRVAAAFVTPLVFGLVGVIGFNASQKDQEAPNTHVTEQVVPTTSSQASVGMPAAPEVTVVPRAEAAPIALQIPRGDTVATHVLSLLRMYEPSLPESDPRLQNLLYDLLPAVAERNKLSINEVSFPVKRTSAVLIDAELQEYFRRATESLTQS